MTASKLVLEQIEKMRSELVSLEKEKAALNRRLDFILDGASQDEIQNFKKEYKQNAEKLNQSIAAKSDQIAENVKKADLLVNDEFNWKELGKNSEAVLTAIQDKDPVALKNAYRHLFEAIVVGDLDKDGKTELKFVLRGQDSGGYSPSVNGRKDFSFEIKMAQEEGLKNPTRLRCKMPI